MTDSDTDRHERRLAVVWTAASAAGVVLHVAWLLDAVTDRAYVRSLGLDDGADEVAGIHVRHEATRLGVKSAWTIVGILALVTGRTPPAWVAWVLRVLLVAGVVALDVVAVMERRSRKRLIARARRRQ